VDDKQLAADAASLAKVGETAQLMTMLRDAVDSEPMDPGRRRMLIDYLNSQGGSHLAADEAVRAAALLPEAAEFHVLAARAFMQSGDTAKARNELNEAVARDPESYETRLLLGELSLMSLDLKAAQDHFDKALSKGSTSDGLFKRALTNALLGNKDAAQKDMAEAVGAGDDGQTQARRYSFAVTLADKVFDDLIDKSRNLITKARRKASDPDVNTELTRLTASVDGLTQLVGLPPLPKDHTPSQQLRVLALNLLAQCLSQIDTFVKNQDGDALADATVNLGEAVKQAGAAKEAFQSELHHPAG
jgi:tetratricopeptide (TPR) repeat protein